MKCQRCGTEFESNFCPNCGFNNSMLQRKCEKCGRVYIGNYCPKGCNSPYYAKQKRQARARAIFGSILGIFLVFAATMGILFGEEVPTNSNASGLVSTQATDQSEEQQETTKSNLYETEKYLTTVNGVKATFIKVSDPKTGVTAFNVSLKLENNGQKKVTVSLTEGYVNDTAVTFFTGLPVEIAPGKSAYGTFIFGYDGLGFSKIEEIEKMQFKVTLMDDNFEMINSETVKLNFK